MKILFTHAYFYRLDAKQWHTHQPYPPLGTLYAAALMRESGHEVALFDVGLRENGAEIIPILAKEKPDVLVIYDDGFNYLTKMCLTTMREEAFRMAEYAAAQGIKVWVSSSDSTDHYEKYLDHHAEVVMLGEAEMTLKELTENKDLATIQGIAFRQENKTIINPKRPVIRDLDILPQPAWDLVDIQPYKDIWLKHQGYFTLNIATTRGCPYKCNWCAKPIYGNRYNSRSPKKVVAEIEYLLQHFAPEKFWMCDDIFGLKPGWVQEFRDLVKEKGLKFQYKIQSRVDLLLEKDSIKALADSGLETVWVGAESGSQKILDAMDKGTKVEEIYEARRKLKEEGIKVAFFLQFGYLDETFEDIEKTIDMVKTLLPDDIGVSVSYPLPGTLFYEKVKADLQQKANWTDSDDLSMMFQNTYPSAFYKQLHRYIHKVYRKAQGLDHLYNLRLGNVRSIVAALFYYTPLAWWGKRKLKAFLS